PWRAVAEPHEDIRQGRFSEDVFAADLGVALQDRGSLDYRDPVTFYQKTYITRGLRRLLVDCMQRLGGPSGGHGVLRLQTPFGGGKTHVLIALYHLIAHGDQLTHREQIQELLAEAGLEAIPQARVAVLIGTALDPAQGRRTDEGWHLQTLWQELAYQLGGADLYRELGLVDRPLTAPGTDWLGRLLDHVGPCLILMDEALEYATKAASVSAGEGTLLDQTLGFLQELSTAVANQPRAMFVCALPSSYMERYGAGAERAYQQMTRVVGRQEEVRTPVRGVEVYEILRRRLFETVGDEAQHRTVAEAYWEHYRAHSDDLPAKVRETAYRQRIVQAYPFHPELVDILYERWGSLPTFQRTRGVLQLLARVIGDLWQRDHAAPLIQPRDVNLGDPLIRSTFLRYVDDAYDSVIGADIADHGAKAEQIDRDLGGDYAAEHIARGLGTAIFLYSHTGGADRGATVPELRLALLRPEMTPALVADALDRLQDQLWYLYRDPKWRFDTQANLNRILVDAQDTVDDEEITARVRAVLNDMVGREGFQHVYLWPHENSDVADDRRPGLVLLDPSHPIGEEATSDFIEGILDRHGQRFRSNKNSLVFLAPSPEGAAQMRDSARQLLAAETVQTDYGNTDHLTPHQQEQLDRILSDSRSALPQHIYQVYRHVVLPAEGGNLERLDMGMQLSNSNRTLSLQVWEFLIERDRLLTRLDPHLIRGQRWSLWPQGDEPLNTVKLRDYFARYPRLPILAGEEVLRQSISYGVKLGRFGYGEGGEGEEKYAPLYFGSDVSVDALHIDESAWLLPPDMARKLSLHGIAGTVHREEDGQPLAGVRVHLQPEEQAVTTGRDGRFAFDGLPSGTVYKLAPMAEGYVFSPPEREIEIADSDVADIGFVARESVEERRHDVKGRVVDEEGQPLEGVTVTLDAPGAEPVTTDARGSYAFAELPPDSYRLTVREEGYSFEPAQQSILVSGETTVQDVVGRPEEIAGGGTALRVTLSLPWEKWLHFYNKMLDPLNSSGAQISMRLILRARDEEGLSEDLLQRLRDRLQDFDPDAEVRVE
ncbi:MAG: ATP-binding protein, partial [Chloroflexota bacterium]